MQPVVGGPVTAAAVLAKPVAGGGPIQSPRQRARAAGPYAMPMAVIHPQIFAAKDIRCPFSTCSGKVLDGSIRSDNPFVSSQCLSSSFSGFLQHLWRSHDKWAMSKARMSAKCLQCTLDNPTCTNVQQVQYHQDYVRSGTK
ncbi:hypothetical protein PRIPAC_72770 [Pristionchus pacificus]|uniref:Uncharacterized protein n=1 Tax=Pristionchus pacificus TaxID=54126 RepID=A0A2A6CZG3_PRIPA|nr:hypothetical protein PRIPAC_72770 [Pristionchus pacificus]|eukprot:PDM83549.1 hypothetical protein PRIPAC_30036 [Pristionchus pacificus]